MTSPPIWSAFLVSLNEALRRAVGETSGGPLRFVRQETPITPQRLPRFGIKGNEALRVGSSRFLGESDAGEAGLQTESESFK